MIWYLLFPIRKTVNPPPLHPGHPIRDAVEGYAYRVASNPATTILLSVTIGLVTCFLSFLGHASGSASGALALPGHMWTSARALDNDFTTPPDFTVKQAWIHGKPMNALDRDVLKEALLIQEVLLGLEGGKSSSPVIDGLSTAMERELDSTPGLEHFAPKSTSSPPGLVLHSPLYFWGNSMAVLDADLDIPTTINRKSSEKTPYNLTLRQPSLFAGKQFSKDKLIAADAAILSFLFPSGSEDVGRWNQRAESLDATGRWEVFLPRHGQSVRTYEFKLSTVSRKEDFLLGLAYVVMLVRIVLALREVQAIRSRFVLLPAIVTQNCLSVMSTFAAMALVRMDYSRIPLEAYAFIVSIIGFDNALRLINAVLQAPAENSTNARVARALGDITIHMLSPLERIVFLWLLSKIVSPLVASYCAFIAIAHMFDMFYHLAFFVPIFCIDLERLELQESIARQKPVSSSRTPINPGSEVPTTNSLDKLPSPQTDKPQAGIRIAGTAVMICFLLALDWQCCSNQTIPRVLRRALSALTRSSSQPPADFWSELMQTVRPSRSLTSWLYLQNQETAEEILRVMKPKARGFEAIIYDPLVIVMKGAQRRGDVGSSEIPSISLETLNASQLITLTILFVAAITTAWLMLRFWVPSGFSRSFPRHSTLKAVAYQEHEMDIIVMAASSKGMLITISLDKEVYIWRLQKPDVLELVHSFILANNYWPIVAVSISEDSKWAVFYNYKGTVSFWNCERQEFLSTITIQPAFSQSSWAFHISSEPGLDPRHPERAISRIAIVRPSGWLTEVTSKGHDAASHRIGSAPIIFSTKPPSAQSFSVFSLSKDANIYLTKKFEGTWYSRKVDIQKYPPTALPALSVATFPGLSSVYVLLSASARMAFFINARSHTVIHSFRIMAFTAKTARGLFHSSYPCNRCGGVSVSSIALAYTDPETKSLIMHTFAPKRGNASGTEKICLGTTSPNSGDDCSAFEYTEEQLHVIENVASWEQLDSNTVTGIRERVMPKSRNLSNNMEGRRRIGHRNSDSLGSLDEDWEAWMMSILGQSMSCFIDRSGQRIKLAVSKVGSAQRIGRNSVAVAFGNSVIILSAGEDQEDRD